jgi:hypothetical protein
VAELSHKPYPAGRATHAGVEALIRLRQERPFTLDEVEAVTIVGPPVTARLCSRPDVPEPTQNYARLCMAFIAAKVLLHDAEVRRAAAAGRASGEGEALRVTRNEVVALVNVFHRLAISIDAVKAIGWPSSTAWAVTANESPDPASVQVIRLSSRPDRLARAIMYCALNPAFPLTTWIACMTISGASPSRRAISMAIITSATLPRRCSGIRADAA